MQYIEYEFAKDNDIIGQTIYIWLQTVGNTLNIRTKGKIISDWREGKLMLNIGDTHPGIVTQQTLDNWTKFQADKTYHKKAYQSAYLKGYFKL